MAGMQWRISACLVASKSKNFFTKFLDFFYFSAQTRLTGAKAAVFGVLCAEKDVARDRKNFYGKK